MKRLESRNARTPLFLSLRLDRSDPASTATTPVQKKAKEPGFPSDNCLYCLNEKLPRKDAATNNKASGSSRKRGSGTPGKST